MSCICLHIAKEDVEFIKQWLIKTNEIAFIVPTGNGMCVAKKDVESLEDGEHRLWHINSGNIISYHTYETPYEVLSPYEPWSYVSRDPKHYRDSKVPYLGGAPINIINFDLHTTGYDEELLKADPNVIGRSDFTWIGSRYEPAPEPINKFWKKLGNFVRKNATKGHESGLNIYQFPHAKELIEKGQKYNIDPYIN
jgi:hypothetical protein